MEKLFDKLTEKIDEGYEFFDIIAQLMKAMDNSMTIDDQFKHVKLITANHISPAMYGALIRAGFSDDDAAEYADYVANRIFA